MAFFLDSTGCTDFPLHITRISMHAFKKRNKEFLDRLEQYFQMRVSIPRVRGGKKQELETLINEEAQLFARYIRCKRKSWVPRIVRLE